MATMVVTGAAPTANGIKDFTAECRGGEGGGKSEMAANRGISGGVRKD